jgi:hypothetical protein
MKKKLFMETIFSILLVSLLLSCGNEKEPEYTYIDLSNPVVLDSPETLIEFDDTHPVDLMVKDSMVFIVQVQTEFLMGAFNLNTKEIKYFGRSGQGPGEFISTPDFILTPDADVLVNDNAAILKKIVTNNGTVEVVKTEQLKISGAQYNFSDNFIVAYHAGQPNKKMFFIYNKNTDSVIYTDFYPKMNLESTTADPFYISYLYSPNLGLNEEKNRIAVGMYYFDMFYLYDLTGKRIKSFCFSKNCIPDIGLENPNEWRKSIGGFIVNIVHGKDYCYFVRISKKTSEDGSENEDEMLIVQVNWDGELIKTYKFTDEISSRIDIDEKNRKLYAIRHYITEKDEEFYALVTYNLE